MNENFIIVIDRLTRTKFIYRLAKADDGFKLDLPPLRILQCVYIYWPEIIPASASTAF